MRKTLSVDWQNLMVTYRKLDDYANEHPDLAYFNSINHVLVKRSQEKRVKISTTDGRSDVEGVKIFQQCSLL